jgi:hypothetical protein
MGEKLKGFGKTTSKHCWLEYKKYDHLKRILAGHENVKWGVTILHNSWVSVKRNETVCPHEDLNTNICENVTHNSGKLKQSKGPSTDEGIKRM